MLAANTAADPLDAIETPIAGSLCCLINNIALFFTTAVMACDSGKTLVGLWVAQAIKSVLVLVASLSLLSQEFRAWR